MAGPSVTAARVAWATRRLMECRSTSATVAALAEWAGISRRQARRLVGRAHEQLALDLEEAGLERRQLAAQLVHALQEAVAIALRDGHPSAAVGAARELRELVHLTHQQPTFGSYGRSRWQ